MTLPAQPFDPNRYLTKVKGSDYLEVKWRLVWLRDQHPDATIETDLIANNGNHAIFRAKVTVPSGGSATGWGSEDINGFQDYIEKAETKAVGRALAMLGFGTQFCDDMVFDAEASRVVDSPVNRGGGSQPTALFGNGRPQAAREDTRDHGPSSKQLSFIKSVSRELHMTTDELDQFVIDLVGRNLDQLDRRDASTVIEALKGRSQGGRTAPSRDDRRQSDQPSMRAAQGRPQAAQNADKESQERRELTAAGNRLNAIADAAEWNQADLLAYAMDAWPDVEAITDLTLAQINEIHDDLREGLQQKPSDLRAVRDELRELRSRSGQP